MINGNNAAKYRMLHTSITTALTPKDSTNYYEDHEDELRDEEARFDDSSTTELIRFSLSLFFCAASATRRCTRAEVERSARAGATGIRSTICEAGKSSSI